MENTMHNKAPLIVCQFDGSVEDFENYLTKIGEYYFKKGQLKMVKCIQKVQIEFIAAYRNECRKRGK